MATGGNGIVFKVTDTQSGRKSLLKFEQYSTFKEICKETFEYQPDSDVVFVLEEDDDVELEESVFECLENRTKLKMKPKHGLTSTHPSGQKSEDDDKESQQTERTSSTWSEPIIEQFTSGYIKEQLKKRGKDQLKCIIEEADKMTIQPLAIGVLGSSGQGKSTLINTLRDLHDHSDEDWAPVDEIETTMERRPYKHPIYHNLVFWDIPGVGTNNFKRETYLSDIKFDLYDFYLICSSTRFTENDHWLIEEVKHSKRKCYFLRTKVDLDVQNAQRRDKRISEKETLGKIRKYCRENIGIEHKVFLIDCHEKDQYDFPIFLQTLCAEAPKEQARSLTLGLVSVSVEMIEQKAMYLKSEIWKTAALSALGGVVFVPGFSFAVDSALIYRKLKEYQRQFELTDAHIKKYAESIGLPEAAFRRTAGLKIDFDFIRKQGINYLIKSVAVEMMAEEAVRFVPFIGAGIAAGMSYRTTGKMLGTILDDCKHDAISVFTLVTKRQTRIE